MRQDDNTSVLILDACPVVRWGVKHFIESQGMHIVGEAESIADAVMQAKVSNPKVIIIDTSLPGASCTGTMSELSDGGSRSILAFSNNENWGSVEAFINAGGSGYVSKRCPPEELINAIRAVEEGHKWISSRLRETTSAGPAWSTSTLSERETNVAVLVARGLTTRQIADQLCVSPKTVETHRYRIFKKLGIQSRAQLVEYTIEQKLLLRG